LTFTSKGTFWQGRYALPFLMGAPLLLGVSLDRLGRGDRVLQQLVPVTGILATSAAAIHLVHLERQRPSSAGDPHWHVPPSFAIVMLAIAAAAAFVSAVHGASRSVRDAPVDVGGTR
jgi:hypothetical protein